jgi:hypothetical protein
MSAPRYPMMTSMFSGTFGTKIIRLLHASYAAVETSLYSLFAILTVRHYDGRQRPV